MRLENKVAVVTDSSKGVGAEIALLLASEGADVVLAGRTVNAVAGKIKGMGRRAIPVKTDMTVRADVESLVELALSEFGCIDILVNSSWFADLCDQPLDDLIDSFKTDGAIGTFKGVIDITRAVLPHMQARKYGRIVNIAGIAAHNNKMMKGPVYEGLKAGVTQFTISVAAIVGAFGININCVAPGFIDEQNAYNTFPADLKNRSEYRLSLRMGSQEKAIAQAVLFLADDATGSYITGSTIKVDGEFSPF